MAEEYDVVIIGAGLSGLVAAYTISKHMPSAKLIVLESSDHIGGPIVTVDMKTSHGLVQMDVGSWRMGSAQTELAEFLKELELETYDMYESYSGKNNKFWQLADGKLVPYSGNLPPLPYTTLLDLLRYSKKVDSLCSEVNLENPAASKQAAEWDTTSVKDFSKSILWTEAGRQTVESLCGTLFSADSAELKLMNYLYTMASDGGWDNHTDSQKKKFNIKMKGGLVQLCNKLVLEIGGSRILKNQPVSSIKQNDDGQNKAVIKTSSGQEYVAKRVVCTIPPNELGAVEFEPAFEVERVGPFLKVYNRFSCVLTYSTSFWREDGNAGEVFSVKGNLSLLNQSDEYPILGVFDHTDENSNPALVAMMGAPDNIEKTADERKNILLTYLKDVFGDKIMEPLDYQELAWNTEFKGPAPRRDIKPSEVLSGLRTPHGCVHWAGSFTATAWVGCLAGAVQAGQRAANEVVAALS